MMTHQAKRTRGQTHHQGSLQGRAMEDQEKFINISPFCGQNGMIAKNLSSHSCLILKLHELYAKMNEELRQRPSCLFHTQACRRASQSPPPQPHAPNPPRLFCGRPSEQNPTRGTAPQGGGGDS